MEAGRSVADWRSAAPYEALRRCGRHGFAWEWLRRSPSYQAACAAAGADPMGHRGAERFGLHCFEEVDRGVPAARPIWRAEADPHVLAAVASAGNPDDESFDAARVGPFASCHVGPKGAEHWLFSDGWRQVRLDITDGSLRCGAARLNYQISGLGRALPRIASLTRLISLARTGRLAPSLFPPERRAARWALVLRVHDALVAGASQREIAAHLFGLEALPRWRVEAPSYRRRAQRLVVAARTAAGADPRSWLNGNIG